MQREEVIRLAREAGFEVSFDIWAVSVDGVHINKELQRFASLVAAAEREACAKVCDGLDVSGLMSHPSWLEYTVRLCSGLATAIRARSKE